jgi:NAD(P)-dependent dehydrogenase (short-subunit alcohol dehydrogenase family)
MATEEELFSGKTAVITGAGSGIGAALARHAAGLGMRLVLADVAEERLAEVAAEVGGTAEILAVPTDVTNAAAVERLAARAYDELGPVRLLFNNAGIESTGPLWELTPQRWDLMMRVNVYGVFHGIHAFVPRMLADGGPAFPSGHSKAPTSPASSPCRRSPSACSWNCRRREPPSRSPL